MHAGGAAATTREKCPCKRCEGRAAAAALASHLLMFANGRSLVYSARRPDRGCTEAPTSDLSAKPGSNPPVQSWSESKGAMGRHCLRPDRPAVWRPERRRLAAAPPAAAALPSISFARCTARHVTAHRSGLRRHEYGRCCAGRHRPSAGLGQAHYNNARRAGRRSRGRQRCAARRRARQALRA